MLSSTGGVEADDAVVGIVCGRVGDDGGDAVNACTRCNTDVRLVVVLGCCCCGGSSSRCPSLPIDGNPFSNLYDRPPTQQPNKHKHH